MNKIPYKMLLSAVLLAFLVTNTYASVSGTLEFNGRDTYKILSALTSSMVKLQKGDVDSVYYGAKGFHILKENMVKVLQLDGCAHLKREFNHEAPENIYHAITAHSYLKCDGKLESDATIKTLNAKLETPSSTVDIYYAIEALKFLGKDIPNPSKVSQLLQQLLKEDDSLQSLGHALHAASHLGSHGKFALDRVEDVVVQADEIDGRMLQWEGGLSTTSLLLTGLLRLPGAKPFNQEQADKFANYLFTRRSVQTGKGALALIEAVNALAASSVAPVSITLAKSSQVTVDKPDLAIKISDILGQALKTPPSPVVAQSATRIADDVVVLSKQPLSVGAVPTEFILPLRLEPGQYRIALSAGPHSTTIVSRVLGPINLQSLEIGLGDSDGTSAPKMNKLQHPQKLSSVLQADSNQNLIVKFNLPRSVHQAFLRLHSGKKEIIFIAEKDNSQTYKINVNLASELSYSGKFEMELILGDNVMSNPIRWNLGSVDLVLPNAEPPKTVVRGPKPEIKHMFRVAEKRPPQAVSMLFTAAAASPLLILFILWIKIGIPLNYFNFYSIPFHVGYAGILALYAYFWLCGNMFTTCAWLLYIGGFTFIAGNRMLRNLASHKKIN